MGPQPTANANTEPLVIYDRRTEPRPLLSFFVPVLNERPFIGEVLEKLSRVPLSKEIIVVDDGSTDGTRKLLRETPQDGVALLFHTQNKGKGQAIQTALEKAKGAYAAIHDADLEYDPNDYVTLLKQARQNNLKVVFGSRFLQPTPRIYRRFLWGNKVLTAWINFLCSSTYTDAYTGAKLMSTSTWKALHLVSSGFEIEAEIAAKVARGGYPFSEWPISYAPRRIEEGKKITWKDFFRGALAARRFAYGKQPPLS
ncbi:MAG: glycosyltransferase family 2 protein [Elusimicrobia bacterium]|jgi:dolichol-phosphate mannosyltransferase|nr:glycosyltransferase family 2 protein [Elusimicrobiota bacterium]